MLMIWIVMYAMTKKLLHRPSTWVGEKESGRLGDVGAMEEGGHWVTPNTTSLLRNIGLRIDLEMRDWCLVSSSWRSGENFGKGTKLINNYLHISWKLLHKLIVRSTSIDMNVWISPSENLERSAMLTWRHWQDVNMCVPQWIEKEKYIVKSLIIINYLPSS